MSKEEHNEKVIGQAKTVLVFGDHQHAQAVISAIHVRLSKARTHRRVNFVGPGRFSTGTVRHIRRVILGIVDGVLDRLDIPKCDYEISVLNVGAAAIHDIDINVSGYSADAAIFLTLLSAAMEIPIPQDIVATGHIASIRGDISAVAHIPEKLKGVLSDGSINQFIYPDTDGSLPILCPQEYQRIRQSTFTTIETVKLCAIRDIVKLCQQVFAEEDILLASLRLQYWNDRAEPRKSDASTDRLLDFWAGRCTERFWLCLDNCFLQEDYTTVRRLMRQFVGYYLGLKRYPPQVGHRLSVLIRSILPAKRLLQHIFPLIDTGTCFQLVVHAPPELYHDALTFIDAIHGRHLNAYVNTGKEKIGRATGTIHQEKDAGLFDFVISQVSEDMIVSKVDLAIDTARGSYCLEQSYVTSQDEFIEIVQAYYVYLISHTNGPVGEPETNEKPAWDCIQLIEEVYKDHGGLNGAYLQARDGTGGALRGILDRMTDHYKREGRINYVHSVFKKAIDDFDWEQRKTFVQDALKRLGPLLPEDVRNAPPERYAESYETIADAYLKLKNELCETLNAL